MAEKKEVVFDVKVVTDVKSADQQINNLIESTESLRTQYKLLREAALNASDPAVADRFAQAAGEINDQIGDIRAQINNFASDTKNLDVAIGAVTGVASAFSVAQGAAALFGSENKNLEKTLAKVQGSIALLNGLQQIQLTLQKESAIGAKIQAASQAVLSSSFLGTSAAAKVFRVALASTGVGLLVIALASLITNFDKVKEAVYNFIPGLKAVGEAIGSVITAITDFFGLTSQADRDLAKFEEATNKNNEAIDRQIKLLEAQGGKEEEIFKLKTKRIDDEIAVLRKRQEVNKKLTEEELKQLKDLENEKQIAAINEKKRLEEVAKKAAEEAKKAAEDEKKKQEEANKRYQDYLKKQNDIRVANKTREIALIEDGNKREIAAFDFQREEIRKKAKEAGENLVLVDQETQKLRLALLAKQAEDQQKLILDNTKALAEADGKLTLDELKKTQSEELKLLQLNLQNKKITQEQFDIAVLAQQTALNNKIKEDEASALDQRLKDTENYYALLALKEGEAGLSVEQVKAQADAKAAIYKEQLDKQLLSKSEYDLKIAEGEKAVADATRTKLESDLSNIDTYYQNLASKQGQYGLTPEQVQAKNDAEAVKYKELLDKKLISEDEYNAKISANTDALAEKEKQFNEGKLQGALNLLNDLQTLTTFFAGKDEKSRKKAFELNKKLQIAQALIQTYQGANAAFAAASANPLTTIFPAYPFISAAAAVAAGLANVAKIKSQKFEGGGASGGGGGGTAPNSGGGGAVSAPPNPFANQQASGVISPTGRPQQQTDNRVYVVESDITKTQNRVRVIETNSNVV
jgi:hypothetical protein